MRHLLALAALVTIGATSPPRFAVVSTSVAEAAGSVSVEIDKSAKASSYSTIKVSTVDGTAKAGVDYQAVSRSQTVANNTLAVRIPVPIIARPGYQGPRTFKLHLSVSRYGTVRVADATITINDSEPAVTWTKCADEGQTCWISGTANVRYGSGSTWATKSITGSIGCNNSVFGDPLVGTFKECDTDGTVAAPAPVPTPVPTPAPTPTGSWVAAPLSVGGYAWLKNQGPCCNGLIVKIVDSGMTSDADQARRQHWWSVVYYSDASGNFPATNSYWQTAWMTGFDEGLQGITPAP